MRKDQRCRKILKDSIGILYSKDSDEYIKHEELMLREDSVNQIEFLNYIKEDGYPGIYKSRTDIMGTILLHVHNNLLEAFNKVLLKEIKKGNIDPFYYGRMMDRIGCIVKNESYYYSYPVKKECVPEGEQIIKNRIRIGMSPYFHGPRRFVNILNSNRLKL